LQKLLIMNILQTIDICLQKISPDIIDRKVLYIEVDRDSYEGLDEEYGKIAGNQDILFKEQKVADIGTCKVFNFRDFKVIITQDKNRSRGDNFYVAFKTKVL